MGVDDTVLSPSPDSVFSSSFGWANGKARLQAVWPWVGIRSLGESQFAVCGGGPYEGFTMSTRIKRQ